MNIARTAERVCFVVGTLVTILGGVAIGFATTWWYTVNRRPSPPTVG